MNIRGCAYRWLTHLSGVRCQIRFLEHIPQTSALSAINTTVKTAARGKDLTFFTVKKRDSANAYKDIQAAIKATGLNKDRSAARVVQGSRKMKWFNTTRCILSGIKKRSETITNTWTKWRNRSRRKARERVRTVYNGVYITDCLG